jgi:pyruvate/2-oxoglutarate dehydrogenase complex dihydrolipoamide dehydrogenase (E3) component
MSDHFDLIVIGAGSAAREAAGRASREFGARVAMIERERWGGSCPNVACRPTKAYLVAAELAYTVNELSDWMGVECGPAHVNLARVRAWKDSIRRSQESWLEVLAEAGYELVPGVATFAS